MKKTIKKVAVLALCVVMGTSVCACGSNNNEALYLEKIAQLEQELIDVNKETQKQLDKIESLEKDLADANKKIEDAEKKEIKIDYPNAQSFSYDVVHGLDVKGKNVVVEVSNLRDSGTYYEFTPTLSSVHYKSFDNPNVKDGDTIVITIKDIVKSKELVSILGSDIRYTAYYEILERR